MLFRLGDTFINLNRLESIRLERGRRPAAYLRYDNGDVEAVTGPSYESMEESLAGLAKSCQPAGVA